MLTKFDVICAFWNKIKAFNALALLFFRFPRFKIRLLVYTGARYRKMSRLQPFFPNSFYLGRFFRIKSKHLATLRFRINYWSDFDNYWNIVARLINDYALWPWIIHKRVFYIKHLESVYKYKYPGIINKFKFSPQLTINVKTKIKPKITIMRNFFKNFLFLQGSNTQLSKLIFNLINFAIKNNLSAYSSLYFTFFHTLSLFLGFNFSDQKSLKFFSESNELTLLPISKYFFRKVWYSWQKTKKYTARLRIFRYVEYKRYLHILNNKLYTKRYWFFLALLYKYDLPRTIEIDYLTLSIFNLNCSTLFSYKWKGLVLYSWWAFFSYYNWKFFY